jgi:hypothetical protein
MLNSLSLYSNMKIKLYLIFALFGLIACHSKEEAAYYFNEAEQDSLLVNLITCVSEIAPMATDSTKMLAQFRAYYQKKAPDFHLIHLQKDSKNRFCYLVSRPVAGRKDLRRGVVGTFTLIPGSLNFQDFEEVVNTPHFDEETVKVRGGFLFRQLVLKGNLDAYLGMKHYVEWPDAYLTYDKKKRSWVSTIGL